MKTSLAIATPASAVKSAEARVSGYDWKNLSDELSGFGCTVIRQLLSPDECRQIAALYPDEGEFRSHVHMARYGFGKGEYKYFGNSDFRVELSVIACRHLTCAYLG
jgi:uncharacterized protein